MTTPGRSVLLLGAGLIVATFAVIALTKSSRVDPPAAETRPVATVAPAVTTAAPREAEVPVAIPERTVKHIETPPPVIAGISEDVARVLTARGFAEMIGAEDPSGEIPDSIVAVLGERGVTLSVAQEPEAP